jgi:hypothetical protein
MYVRKALMDGMQKLMVRFLIKGPGSSLMIAGSLALAGVGAVALNSSSGAPIQQSQSTIAPSTEPSAYGCFNDRDGDGTIKCASSVQISTLPAAWGSCQADVYGDGLTVCDGTSNR